MLSPYSCAAGAALLITLLSLAPAAAQPPAPLPGNLVALAPGAVGRLGGGQYQFRNLGPTSETLTVSADGRTIAYALPDGGTVVRPVAPAGNPPAEVVTLGPAPSLGLSPDGKALATGFGGPAVVDVRTRRREAVADPTNPVPWWSGIAFSADGRRVVANGSSFKNVGRVVVWDRTTNSRVLDAVPLTLTHLHVGLSADGKTAASGGSTITKVRVEHDHVIQVWDVDAGKERARIATEHPVGAIGVSADGSLIAAATQEGPGLTLYEVARQRRLRLLDVTVAPLRRPVFSAGGERIAAATPTGEVRVWEVGSGKQLSATPAPAEWCGGVTFTGADQGVAWGGRGLEAVVWEFPSGKVLSPRTPHAYPISSVAFAPDGKAVLSGDEGGVLAAWEPARPADAKVTQFRRPGRPSRPDESPVGMSGPLSIAPGGGTVAMYVSGGRPTDYFYDRATGRQLYTLSRDRAATRRLPVFSFVADHLFVPRGYDTGFRRQEPDEICRADSGAHVAAVLADYGIKSTEYGARSAAFSPDGKRLVTAGQVVKRGVPTTTLVTSWHAKTGAKLGEIAVPQVGTVFHVAATNSGGAVLSQHHRIVALDVPAGVEGEVLDAFESSRHTGPGALAFSHDGKLLAAGVPTDTHGVYGVRVYEWPSGRQLHEFRGHTGRVTALAFSADGKLLVSGSEDTSVVVWDVSPVGKR